MDDRRPAWLDRIEELIKLQEARETARIVDPQQILHDKAAQLITLLEVNEVLGSLALTAPSGENLYMPTQLQMFPSKSPRDSLYASALWQNGDLSGRIAALELDPEVKQATEHLLVAEYAAIRSDADHAAFKTQDLGKMIQLILQERTCANEPSRSPRPFLSQLYLTLRQMDVQDALTKISEQQNGHLAGYTLQNGNWMYQVIYRGTMEVNVQDLSTTAQYHSMRRILSDGGLYVRVWHEATIEAAQGGQTEPEAMIMKESDLANNVTMAGSITMTELARQRMEELKLTQG